MEPGLYETATYRAHTGNFPNGAHVCEVEIDPETGITRLVRYAVVDDVGTVINPMLVRDSWAALLKVWGRSEMEDKVYDASGQVLSGSFMDYAMPRAEHFCDVKIEDNPVPTSTNPLGVKGAGEAGRSARCRPALTQSSTHYLSTAFAISILRARLIVFGEPLKRRSATGANQCDAS